MSNPSPRHRMPPGLKSQIAFAVIITLAALLVLPTALSAQQSARTTTSKAATKLSAGTIKTTIRDFSMADFSASAYTDWNE